jgi:uncharacterized membrane protein YeaQ/YmgE (transglycosylase-associated protein family)
MDTPLLNFVAAIGIGLIIGVLGGFTLRSKSASAMWMAPVLSLVGALVASGIAAVFGDRRDYGYKEAILQVVLSIVGVGLAYFLTARGGSNAAASSTAS